MEIGFNENGVRLDCIPPEVPGLVWATNYGATHVLTGEIVTEATAKRDAAKWLGVPEDTIRVIPFEPTGGTRFAAYVEKEHESKVHAKCERLAFLLLRAFGL